MALLWEKGVQPEIIGFLEGLNWTFIIMFITILYGIKHTYHFNWFGDLLEKIKASTYKVWIAALLTGIVIDKKEEPAPKKKKSKFFSAKT